MEKDEKKKLETGKKIKKKKNKKKKNKKKTTKILIYFHFMEKILMEFAKIREIISNNL